MNKRLRCDREMLLKFLDKLDPEAEFFTFQTFDDDKSRKRPELTKILHGHPKGDEFWDQLNRLNEAGAGIFVTVNETNGKGRKKRDIVRCRAIFQEADIPNPKTPALAPHIVVETSPGKTHRYWLIDSESPPSFEEWEQVQLRMTTDFDSDKNAKDLTRVLRAPGFYHQKNPYTPLLVKLIGGK